MKRPVEAIINLGNIRKNMAQARKLAVNSKMMAVIKDNAYGHGAVRVAKVLEEEADAFGVACLDEAIALREAGIERPIVLLGGMFDQRELQAIVKMNLQMVIHSPQQLDWFLSGKVSEPVVVWLKLDTGMHRLGFSPQIYRKIRLALQASGNTRELILMSHLACADQRDNVLTERQIKCFADCAADFQGPKSLANSAALISCPRTHYDWVRPGLLLYGANPLSDASLSQEPLLLAMTFRSRLVSLRQIDANEAVGYGQTWRAAAAARIGTVAVGYGDGYPFHAPSGTPVLVGGRRASLVGRVSMDFITVDLTDLPEAVIGDEVVLWGEGLPIEEVAAVADTISYQLLTGIASRVCYQYID
jgi:alanine racemase